MRQLIDYEKQKESTKVLIMDTKKSLKDFLVDINKINDKSDYSLIQIFKWFILKEKSIFMELNKLRDANNILIGLFWCPAKLSNSLDDTIYNIK